MMYNEAQYDIFIDKLLKVIESIESVYDRLYELEISGQENTEQYLDYVNCLREYVKLENKIYCEANLSLDEATEIANYIIEEKLPSDFTNDTDSITDQNYENKRLRRIVSHLVHMIMYHYQNVGKMISDDLIDTLTKSSIKNPEQLVSESIISSIELQSTLENDNNNSFLYFLQRTIDKTNDSNIKNQLITNKYYSIFINKTLESQLLGDNFTMPSTLKLNVDSIAHLDNMDPNFFLTTKEAYGMTEAGHQMSILMESRDSDYSDEKNEIGLLIRKAIIRGGLLFLSENTISKMKRQFMHFSEGKDFKRRNPQHQIGKNAVINCFENAYDDKRALKADFYSKSKRFS